MEPGLPRTAITIPFDILESVVEIIAANADIRCLKALALTCHAMVPLCRKHLFSSVQLSRKKKDKYIGDLLSMNPDIARYIKKLIYILQDTGDADQMVLDALKEHSRLRSIQLGGEEYGSSDWTAFPASIRSSVVSILQLHPITHLDIRCLNNFPRTALFFCHNLIKLRLVDVEMTSDELVHLPRRSKIPTPTVLKALGRSCVTLATLMRTAGSGVGPTVDLSHLKDAMFDVELEEERLVVEEVLRMATQLVTLSIALDTAHMPVPLAVALNANPNNNLKSAAFEFVIHGDDHDPLCGINDELSKLAGKNSLEQVEVSVQVQMDSPCRTDSRDWANLDAVLMGPGFPKLHRVKLEFLVYSYYRSGNEVQDLLNSLTKARFRKLSESTTIAFEFSAENYYH